VIKKGAENVLKHKNLITEIQCMWNMKAKFIPVITGAIGTISKSLIQYLSNIPGNQEIKELPTTAILGTAHMLLYIVNAWQKNASRKRASLPSGH